MPGGDAKVMEGEDIEPDKWMAKRRYAGRWGEGSGRGVGNNDADQPPTAL